MYITTRIREKAPKQLSFEDIFNLMLEEKPDPVYHVPRVPYTRTVWVDKLPPRIIAGCNVRRMINTLKDFNTRHRDLLECDLSSHYRKFFIPKKTGGLREINAPDDQLKLTLTELKSILETEFYAMHHANAYAYIKGRSVKDAVAVHQRNDSRWFLKIDLSGFFPSTTLDFTMNMLSRIYPFALVMEDLEGEEELRKALSMGFLDGVLPMGTPLSPTLTNLIMIPFDHEFSRYLRARYRSERNSDNKGRMFAYTRYADDMHISCRIGFSYKEVIDTILEIFKHFDAPYEIKSEKTHYGSRGGMNWMLGMMLNKDNKITLGSKKKKQLRAMLNNFAVDYKSGNHWKIDELQYLMGILAYHRMVNEEDANNILKSVGTKHGFDIEDRIKKEIAA